VDEFIDSQTIKELSTLENAKLILEQGMPLESRGRKMLYALFPTKTIDSLFLSYPFQERVKINNKVISSTRRIAVKNRDKNLAGQLSGFISRTYDNDWERGSFSSQSFLVNFYKDIKDTINFLQTAESFINYNLMNQSVDSLKRRSDRERNAMFEQKRKDQNGNPVMTFSYAPFYMKYGEELNNVAYGVFTFTNDLEKLAKALKWSKRSLEINEALSLDESRKQNPSYMDTYACLLYRLGKKEEAIQTQTKAIEILKNRNENANTLEVTLNKMKGGTL
jgi:tetratricopeptide (TPR) repeat protein